MHSGKMQHAAPLPDFLVMPFPDDPPAARPIPRLPAAASPSLATLTRAALRHALDQALADCPPADRELLHAAYVDGQPLATLATQQGQTYKALESRLARLRQKIRVHLLRALRHE